MIRSFQIFSCPKSIKHCTSILLHEFFPWFVVSFRVFFLSFYFSRVVNLLLLPFCFSSASLCHLQPFYSCYHSILKSDSSFLFLGTCRQSVSCWTDFFLSFKFTSLVIVHCGSFLLVVVPTEFINGFRQRPNHENWIVVRQVEMNCSVSRNVCSCTVREWKE